MPAALEGLRIVDLSQVWAGPLALKLLGDLGADVIKVESGRRMDSARGDPDPRAGTAILPGGEPGPRPWNRAGHFNDRNRSKRGVCLDLTMPEGIAALKRLAAASDVVAESYRFGVLERLGAGYGALREAKPDLVYVSFSSQGATGPERAYGSYGAILEQTAGIASITGYRGGPPAAYGGAYPDFAIGVQMAFSVLVALRERARSGRGQHIDLSMAETVAAMTPEPLLEHEYLGLDAPRGGNRHPRHAPQGVYRTAGDDRWLALTVETDEQWAALAEAMGRPAWALDARYASAGGRRAHHDAIDAGIGAWTRGGEAEALAALLQARGVPAGPSWGVRDLAADGDLRGRGYLAVVDHAELGPREIAGTPGRFSAMPDRGYRPSPLLGEHNREVFGGLLGLTDAELGELRAEGVIG